MATGRYADAARNVGGGGSGRLGRGNVLVNQIQFCGVRGTTSRAGAQRAAMHADSRARVCGVGGWRAGVAQW